MNTVKCTLTAGFLACVAIVGWNGPVAAKKKLFSFDTLNQLIQYQKAASMLALIQQGPTQFADVKISRSLLTHVEVDNDSVYVAGQRLVEVSYVP